LRHTNLWEFTTEKQKIGSKHWSPFQKSILSIIPYQSIFSIEAKWNKNGIQMEAVKKKRTEKREEMRKVFQKLMFYEKKKEKKQPEK